MRRPLGRRAAGRAGRSALAKIGDAALYYTPVSAIERLATLRNGGTGDKGKGLKHGERAAEAALALYWRGLVEVADESP